MQKAMFIQIAAGLLIGGGAGALMGYFGKCTSGTCPLTANPWRGAFVGALMGGLLASSFGSSRFTAAADDAQGPALRIASADEFDRLALQADKPVLVDFYSNSCGPCRRLAPSIESLAEQYAGRAVVCKVNVDKLPQLADRYGIHGIPTVIFFNRGSEARRLIGLNPQRTYAEVLDKLSQ
jgi:thioredoxin 1